MLPLLWTLFAVLAVFGFVMIGAYWLDVHDRPDFGRATRIGWAAAVLLFPISIPVYALAGGPGWPLVLRIGSFVPAAALVLFFGFIFGAFS